MSESRLEAKCIAMRSSLIAWSFASTIRRRLHGPNRDFFMLQAENFSTVETDDLFSFYVGMVRSS